MRGLLGLAVAAVVAMAVGCATMTAGSHVDRSHDFSRHRTFDWGPPDELPTGDPRLDEDPFFKDNVLGAIEKQLAGRGLTLSTSGEPDLRIHYHAAITTRVNVSRVDRERGYCTGECLPDVTEYEAGTLVVDVIDTRDNRVVWRGWAQDAVGGVLEDRDLMVRKINDAVARIVAQLPAGL